MAKLRLKVARIVTSGEVVSLVRKTESGEAMSLVPDVEAGRGEAEDDQEAPGGLKK